MSSPDTASAHSSVRSEENATAIPIESEIYIDPVVEKRLLRKLDFRLISFAFFSYFTSNLVRNNMRKSVPLLFLHQEMLTCL